MRPCASACSSGMRAPEGMRPPAAKSAGSSAKDASARRSTCFAASGALRCERHSLVTARKAKLITSNQPCHAEPFVQEHLAVSYMLHSTALPVVGGR